ncbi:MAG: FecR domain-containing protein, partial [Ruminococcus sp.]|nr:FecR domain-containing protein [Ruminococcus sp.]
MYQISSSATKPVKVGRLPSENSLTAWATHEFHFDGTPLPQVLDDLSAYYNVDLSCPGAQQKRLTADFHADDLDSIISMIDESLDVKISRK